jgi:hypothetical protein
VLIRWCAHRLGEAEHEVANVLARVPGGLALMGVVLPGRGGREIDALVVRPDRVVTIEAKGTGLSGPVTIPANGPWLIGGQEADFAGGPNPLNQTRVQAQRLRGLCNEAGVRVGFIPAIAVVVGAVELEPHDVAGGVSATDLDHLDKALDRLGAGRRLTRADVRRFLALLDLGTGTPGDADLDNAGFPRDDGSIPEPATAPPPQQYAPPPRYATPPYPQHPHVPPAPPPYAYFAPPPPARRPPRRGQQRGGGPRSPYDTWPNYRQRPQPHQQPHYQQRRRKRRNPLLTLLKWVLGLWLLMALVAAAAGVVDHFSVDPTPTPTPTHAPHRRPPATRTSAPR